jgi:hypothetical protein
MIDDKDTFIPDVCCCGNEEFCADCVCCNDFISAGVWPVAADPAVAITQVRKLLDVRWGEVNVA